MKKYLFTIVIILLAVFNAFAENVVVKQGEEVTAKDIDVKQGREVVREDVAVKQNEEIVEETDLEQGEENTEEDLLSEEYFKSKSPIVDGSVCSLGATAGFLELGIIFKYQYNRLKVSVNPSIDLFPGFYGIRSDVTYAVAEFPFCNSLGHPESLLDIDLGGGLGAFFVSSATKVYVSGSAFISLGVEYMINKNWSLAFKYRPELYLNGAGSGINPMSFLSFYAGFFYRF